MKKIFVIDTETTGLDPNKNSLWQLAGYYRNAQGKLFTLDLKCNPLDWENITDEALRVCRTSKEELAKHPPAQQLYMTFRNFLLQEISDGEKITWCGYNSKFDLAFVESFFKYFDPSDSIYRFFDRGSTVDMLEYMRLLRSIGFINTPTLKLEEVYKMFGYGTETAHDALEDAKLTYLLYQWAENTIINGLNHDRK